MNGRRGDNADRFRDWSDSLKERLDQLTALLSELESAHDSDMQREAELVRQRLERMKELRARFKF